MEKSNSATSLVFIALIFILSCTQSVNTAKVSMQKDTIKTTANDSGFEIIKTTKLITGNATKEYSTKERKLTQFALDQQSRKETEAIYIIKISDSKVLICDSMEHVLKSLSVVKKWTDKSGPSTVYDLTDGNRIQYSLDYYIDYQKKDFLAFRFSKTLQTYTNDNN